MRGFGAVQTCFAAEAQMDKLAAALGIDPVELRLLNALEPGDVLPTGQTIDGLDAGRRGDPRAPRRSSRRRRSRCRATSLRLPGGAGNTTRGEGVRRGVGFAVGFKNICVLGGLRRLLRRARAPARPTARPRCTARRPRSGQGVTNVILQVARTELGLDDVRLAPGQTATVELGRLGVGVAA